MGCGSPPVCDHCGDPIGPGEGAPAYFTTCAAHHSECLVRVVFGPAGHQLGACGCAGPPGACGDPPGVSAREGARRAARVFRAKSSGPPFTGCPRCGVVSYHPDDIAQRYCAACHDWYPAGVG